MHNENGQNKFLEFFRDELQKCAKCGACLSVCPVFAEEPREKFAARGKIALCEAVAQDNLPITDEFCNILGNCLLCLACSESCSSGVEIDKIILAARTKIRTQIRTQIRTKARIKTRTKILQTNPGRIQKGCQSLPDDFFSTLPETCGLRLRCSPSTTEEKDIISPYPFIEQVPEVFEVPDPVDTVIFFVGCCVNHVYQTIGETTIQVLNKLGVTVSLPKDQQCCGAPAQAIGDVETARHLAEKNIEILSASGTQHSVIVPCASGGYMFKHVYLNLFAEDRKWRDKASELASRTYDISEYLVNVIGLGEIARHIKQKASEGVAYHAPCHLHRGQGIKAEPEALLKLACEDKFVDMPEKDMCCGAGLGYNISHQELSNKILSRKMKNIRTSGAGVVATGCPGCIMQFLKGIHGDEMAVDAMHTIEVLARSMGIG